MLIVDQTAERNAALQALMKTHRLKKEPSRVRDVYRPFWLGKALYRAETRDRQTGDGTLIFLADARILSWSIIGAYQHRMVSDMLDLRDHQVNFTVRERDPEESAEVLEPLLTQEELSTRSRLLASRRLLARSMKLGRIVFCDDVEYRLIYRPYWEIEYETRRGGTDVALVSRDDVLVRKR